jgi:hypothetical protein
MATIGAVLVGTQFSVTIPIPELDTAVTMTVPFAYTFPDYTIEFPVTHRSTNESRALLQGRQIQERTNIYTKLEGVGRRLGWV